MPGDVSARLHLVAEKLQQKAQDAQRKGNDSAARALVASVSDLRDALALIAEQRHLLARRNGESDDDADAYVQELAGRLTRVMVMLGKKADDMKTKGNENAAVALQQSAVAVDKGRLVLLEQQQTIVGLVERWETLESVVFGEKETDNSQEEHTGEEQEKTESNRLLTRVQYLVNLENVVKEVLPACNDIHEMRAELFKWQKVENETEKLRKEVEKARQETQEAKRRLEEETSALETMKMEMERVKERETTRQEEDAMLLEQQREACQAMEQLVRESDLEIQRMAQSAATEADELESLRREMERLKAEKDRLERIHQEKVKELEGQWTSAMDAALSRQKKEDEDAKMHEIETLQTQLAKMTLEKEKLLKEQTDEMKKLRCQLDQAMIGGKSKKGGKKNVKKLNLLQTKIDALEKEKDCLVALHANEVEALQKAHALAIQELHEKLQSKVLDASTTNDGSDNKKEKIKESNNEEPQSTGEAENTHINDAEKSLDIPTVGDVLPLQEAGNDGDFQEQQQMMMMELEKKRNELESEIERLKNDKIQTVDELQRAHEAEIARMQAELAILQSLVDKTDARYQAQKSTISMMEKEQAELQERIEVLTNEKIQIMNENESLATQIEETKTLFAAKSAEQNEAIEALARCQEELNACRSQLNARDREYSELKREIEAVHDAESREMDDRLSTLSSELDEVGKILDSSEESTISDLSEKTWESPEVTELWKKLVLLVTTLVSGQKQLKTIQEQLERIQKEREHDKLMLDEFLRRSDWRLFAKKDEEMEDVKKAVELDQDFSARFLVAIENVACWLEDLQMLRERVETDASKISAFEHTTEQEQERVVALEGSEKKLQVMIESLQEEVARLQVEKAERETTAERWQAKYHSKSVQEQHYHVAQDEKIRELEHELTTLRRDYERYRIRSHTALKNMEKRAELLNGMRKENEEWMKRVQDSENLRDEAMEACKRRDLRLQEATCRQQMMQVEFDQFATEKMRRIRELEVQVETLTTEKERMETQMDELTIAVQELEREKKRISEEKERILEAEQVAMRARFDTATKAAKQEVEGLYAALEAKKAENEKQQRQLECLEQQLEKQTVMKRAVETEPTPRVSSDVETEVKDLRALETSLRRQLEDARVELRALQERFVTTKAAHADKVFALEEQNNQLKMELATLTEELQRLNAVVDAEKTVKTPQLDGDSTDQDELQSLKSELAHATTENALLIKTLDSCRDELDEAQTQLHHVLAASGSDQSMAALKVTEILAAKDEALKTLRRQVLELQEARLTLEEDKAALALQVEEKQVQELHASRELAQVEKMRAISRQKWQTLLASFEKQLASTVTELQARLQDHSSAYRAVCDYRDQHRAALGFNDADGDKPTGGNNKEVEFQECLVMRSGVVIKAGAKFELPVICEQRGWRVVWSFSIDEEGADVVFEVSAVTKDSENTSIETEIVSPERMHDMSGVVPVRHDHTTLVFRWDNSFSWLNEKTLDYHVSIQEPLTREAQEIRQSQRDVQIKAQVLTDGMALLQVEAERRAELQATLKRLEECGEVKEKHLEACRAHKQQVVTQKTRFQEAMETQKALFAAMLGEQDEVEDLERSLLQAWETAQAEREDAEMTLQLIGNGAQLETLTREIQEQANAIET